MLAQIQILPKIQYLSQISHQSMNNIIKPYKFSQPYYKSLKFKVYNLHSTFKVHIFALLLVFRDGLTALLLVSLGGISTFVFFLLIFTSGGGCRGADGELALTS